MLRPCSAIVSSEKDNNSKFMNTNEQFLKIIQIAIIRYIFEQVKKERQEPTCTLTLYILITIRLVCIFQSITIHHIHQLSTYIYLSVNQIKETEVTQPAACDRNCWLLCLYSTEQGRAATGGDQRAPHNYSAHRDSGAVHCALEPSRGFRKISQCLEQEQAPYYSLFLFESI